MKKNPAVEPPEAADSSDFVEDRKIFTAIALHAILGTGQTDMATAVERAIEVGRKTASALRRVV